MAMAAGQAKRRVATGLNEARTKKIREIRHGRKTDTKHNTLPRGATRWHGRNPDGPSDEVQYLMRGSIRLSSEELLSDFDVEQALAE